MYVGVPRVVVGRRRLAPAIARLLVTVGSLMATEAHACGSAAALRGLSMRGLHDALAS